MNNELLKKDDIVKCVFNKLLSELVIDDLYKVLDDESDSLSFETSFIKVQSIKSGQIITCGSCRFQKIALNTKVEFETMPYLLNHGQEPKGRGYWIFCLTNKCDIEQPHYRSDYVTLTQAKKEARQWAQANGHSILYVAP